MTERPAVLDEPEAWAIVPVEPIREQWAAMADTLYKYKNRHHDKVAGDLFAAMLTARPNPTALSDITAYVAGLEAELLASQSSVRRMTSEEAANARRLIAEGKVFSDTNPEARFIAEAELSCPHCGGSGHKDDVVPDTRAEAAEARVKELETRLAEAEKVIEPFAKEQPLTVDTEYAGRMYTHCCACHATLSEGENHDADCAWLAARAWMGAK